MSKFEKSLASVTVEPAEAIKIIADRMITSRPVTEIKYLPFRKHGCIHDFNSAGSRQVDIKAIHPEVKKGDVVYLTSILDSCADYDGRIHFDGNCKVFINGEEVYDTVATGATGWQSFPFRFVKGDTTVTFMIRCQSDDRFVFRYFPGARQYGMWARFYLLNVRMKSPLPEYRDEDGLALSAVMKEDDVFDGSYVFPALPKFDNSIDFNAIFPDAEGVCAYALTYAACDTELSLNFDCPHKVFVNGSEVEGDTLTLKKDDAVLVKALREGKWSFSFEGDGIGIPFMKSSRPSGDKWLTLGSFGKGKCISSPFGPEYAISFTHPYRNEAGKDTFWKLAGKDDYIRPYLHSRFFGQWFYALMVGTHGLLRASEAVDSKVYKDYFVRSTQIMARYFDYMQYEYKEFGQTTFLEQCVNLDNLDAIGSMGRNMCELYKIAPSEEVFHVIERLGDAAMNNIPRFEDGTFHRATDMWSDDLFMSCPFLMRLAKVVGNEKYSVETANQLLGFRNRLWMKDEKIFSHIFFLDDYTPNNIPWGRGNGWAYVSLSDALINLPDGTPGKDELMQLYLEFTEGVLALQDSDGLWHQVLNRPDSYQETSCTGMFMLGLCRGIKHGWIGRENIEAVKRAYNGLITHKISADGNIYDVCMGSSNSKNAEYYINLGAVDNDDHGTGVILTAIAAMMDL